MLDTKRIKNRTAEFSFDSIAFLPHNGLYPPPNINLPQTVQELENYTHNELNPILAFYQLSQEGNKDEKREAIGKKMNIKRFWKNQ